MMPFAAMRMRSAIAGAPVNPIAISLWGKMTDCWNLEEPSGNYLNGTSGRFLARNGTVGTRQGPAGLGDIAPNFDPSQGTAKASDNAALKLGDRNFAIWFWVICDSASTTRIALSKWDAQSNWREYSVYILSTGIGIQYRNLGDSDKVLLISASVPTSWTFVYIEQDRSTGLLQARINGAASGASTTDAIYSSSSPLMVSGLVGASGSTDFRLDGGLSRLGMAAGTTLTLDEQTYLYSGGAGKTWQEIKADAGIP